MVGLGNLVDAVSVKNVAGTKINPATEDKQDTQIAEFEEVRSGNAVGVSGAKISFQSLFEQITGWVESAGADNLATSTTHRGSGTKSLTFDKIAGSTDAMISISVPATDISEYSIHAIGLGHVYLPSLTNLVKGYIRIGTDASNYAQWDFLVSNLQVGWNQHLEYISAPNSQVGNGYNLSAITYLAIGFQYSNPSNTQAGILCGGLTIKRVLEVYGMENIGTEINVPFTTIKDYNGNTRLDVVAGSNYNYLCVRFTDGTNLIAPATEATLSALNLKVTKCDTDHIAGSVTVSNQVTIPTDYKKDSTKDVEQSDQTKLKATVYQAEKDRTISGTVAISNSDYALEATLANRFGGGLTSYAEVLTTSGVKITPSSGKKIQVYWVAFVPNSDNSNANLVTVKFTAGITMYIGYALAHWEIFTGATNDSVTINLSSVEPVAVCVHYKEVV